MVGSGGLCRGRTASSYKVPRKPRLKMTGTVKLADAREVRTQVGSWESSVRGGNWSYVGYAVRVRPTRTIHLGHLPHGPLMVAGLLSITAYIQPLGG